jgi:hypothetical protein
MKKISFREKTQSLLPFGPFSFENITQKYRNSLQKFPVDTATRRNINAFHRMRKKEWKIATTKNTFEVNEELNLNFHFIFFLCN